MRAFPLLPLARHYESTSYWRLRFLLDLNVNFITDASQGLRFRLVATCTSLLSESRSGEESLGDPEREKGDQQEA